MDKKLDVNQVAVSVVKWFGLVFITLLGLLLATILAVGGVRLIVDIVRSF